MGGREEILSQLYKILDNNNNDIRIYYRLAEMSKRSSLRVFFKNLSYQKRIFCRRIRYEIRELENSKALIPGQEIKTGNLSKLKSFQGLPTLKADIKGLMMYCYKKEQEYLHLYKNLLSNTHLGNIREMLLNQRHAVQLSLNEIKMLENKYNYEKNEGEVNYS